MNRRRFLKAAGLLALSAPGCAPLLTRRSDPYLNDIHAQLNRTRVREIVRPQTLGELRALVRDATHKRYALSVAGGRHAMGTQQFGTDTVHVDTRGLARVLSFDRERGWIEVESGIEWPELIRHYVEAQGGDRAGTWGIAQKQTGADRFTMGGSLSANGHGRALTRRPIVADIESLTLLDHAGEIRRLSRTEDPELFGLVVGGYGLFGIAASVTLRLVPREKVERVVEIIHSNDLAGAFERRIREGFRYGDFQFATDQTSDEFLDRGVFSCYRPVDRDRPMPEGQRRLSPDDWKQLLYLAHADKREAFRRYSTYYLSTSGQLYWSDTHQMSTYLENYHGALDQKLGTPPATEMITEIYVPRSRLADFLAEAREDLRTNGVNVIYGTIRLIEKDDECFLTWARDSWACTIFNLHTEHSPEGLRRSAASFRRLIDMAVRRGGSFYLTYHRWADRTQIEACYPRFREFLRLKRRYDPDVRFQSDWWRHHARMFGTM